MPTRRTFLATSAAAAATFATPAVHAAGSDAIRIGLVGCGGRGRGAAGDALRADKNVKLVAVCDIFPDIVATAADELGTQWKDRCDIGERKFHGFDGYKQLIDTPGIDIVFLATPPGFRPVHLDYAVKAGKHVFAEKPMAVDPAGVRSVLASAKLAKEKGLMCASGFCYRYEFAKKETVKRIHGGQIGEVQAVHVTYNTSALWHRGDKDEWTPMEKQVRNWYYYTWLSGDHLVEQHCHNIDKAVWILNGELPVAATGLGGRQQRTDPKYGNIWDHFAVVYEFANGRKVFSSCRQIPNCHGDINDHVIGTKGMAQLMKHTITSGGTTWEYSGENPGMYVQEHTDMLAALKAGTPVNDMETAANSTLMAIMGREAAYTGKRLTWKMMQESKLDLSPAAYAWGENAVPTPAMPGVTKYM